MPFDKDLDTLSQRSQQLERMILQCIMSWLELCYGWGDAQYALLVELNTVSR
jgi:hypothetical protein